MKEKMTHNEAWKDFYVSLKKSEMWGNLMRGTKQYLSSINKAVKDGEEVNGRIERMLNKYAEGRYNFHQEKWVTKNETILQDNV